MNRISGEYGFARGSLFYGKYIIYTGRESIFAFNMENLQIETVIQNIGVCGNAIRTYDGYLYYLRIFEYAFFLCRVKFDQGWANHEKLINFNNCKQVATTEYNIKVSDFFIHNGKIICKINGKGYHDEDIIIMNQDYSEMRNIYSFNKNYNEEIELISDQDTIALILYQHATFNYKYLRMIRIDFSGKVLSEIDALNKGLTPARELWRVIRKRNHWITYVETELQFFMREYIEKQVNYFSIE